MDKSPWERLELEEIQQKPFPLVRERLKTHTGAEVVFTYIPGQHNWVSALPITPEGSVILLRQYRHVWGKFCWDIPAGGAEPGEAPEAAIRRELLEEAGVTVDELIPLPRHRYMGGIVASMSNPFLALGATRNQAAQPEDGELIEVHELSLTKAYELLESEEDFDAAAVILLLFAKPILQARGLLS